jgi:hypothetical protein
MTNGVNFLPPLAAISPRIIRLKNDKPKQFSLTVPSELINMLNRKKLFLSNIPKWESRFRDYFSSILPQFFSAIRAYQNTVISNLSTLLNGDTWDVNPIPCFTFGSMFSAFSTSKPQSTTIVLPRLHLKDNPIAKNHNLSPTIFDWRKYAVEDYWMFKDGKHTGIIINTVYQLQINRFKPKLITKFIKLKHPVFSINFHPINDSLNVVDLVDMPTLKEAQELAESYYNVWLNVNRDLLTK